MNLDRECRAALDVAKCTVGASESLDVPLLMSALYFHGGLKNKLPQLSSYLEEPVPRNDTPPDKVPVAEALKPVLRGLSGSSHPITAEELLAALLASEPGREYLRRRGMSPTAVDEALRLLQRRPAWRQTPEREEVVAALSAYGRMLTAVELPRSHMVNVDTPLRALIRNLAKMRRRNVIVIGHPGTGKSALVYELARRLAGGDPIIPPQLRDADLFELSPVFLRSGASVVGQYEERVKALLEILQAHPNVILFVDEIHSFFQSGVYSRGPFSDANEAFKGVLGRGEIVCIGCTTPSEYRHHIEPDEALARRFNLLRLSSPSAEATVHILQARIPKMKEYYAPLGFPESIEQRVVELTEEYLPGRYQPDKSIQLLDEACAYCATSEPPLPTLTEAALKLALEDIVGHGIVRTEALSESEVYNQLRAKIIGQDHVLHEIATAFVATLGNWRRGGRPRGVFLFAGPTGVGKTETAVLLSRILGGGQREHLIRVDCNSLQGSGYDSSPVVNRLLGAPPGYVGYARGQGGLLSKIRDLPEAIVLFDELEKADPGIGEILLRIMDEGRTEDMDGNTLDFRRAILIFCTNVGCTYESGRTIGFVDDTKQAKHRPTVDAEALAHGLKRAGFGEEFMGRISHQFLFQGLSHEAVESIVELQLAALRETSETRGLHLDWEPRLVERLTHQWQPRFGVRHLTTILRNRISEQLAVAEAQGEFDGITAIHLRILENPASSEVDTFSGYAARHREDDALIISLL
ncbi:MAG TPA: AAA family ATPase [Candidatus Hydrogenedentes bacterium]|nr:AAA family ATPase [Candidatus Hydrogenedentota bacterium]